MGPMIRFFLENKLIVFLLVMFVVGWGMITAPFAWDLGGIPRNPVPVDAIPDIGENQQIVFTEWMGRSPQDVEDQITYPLTVSLLGLPGVKTIRSFSFFGFSSIYVIFEEDIEFYWSRSRVLEKLSSLPSGTLPMGVAPALGPDATPLGQVYWYTLEGLDPEGNPTGGWDPDELRSIQDWYVRYALMSAKGVSEVASIGGYVREYQVDIDPDAMRAQGVNLAEVTRAVKGANLEVGARVVEINRVEYLLRGTGWIVDVDDISSSVVKAVDGVPVRVGDVAHVSTGPAMRRGALDKGGVGAVGGVVVVRYGENPLAVIENIKKKIEEIAPGLAKKTLADGTVSQVAIVPFYDRSGLIHETLGTLDTAITEEIMVTIIVVIFMLMHLRSSLLISALLPIAVLFAFICMRYVGVDANIVALSGIAIAIGTIVDMGIVLCENILESLKRAGPDAKPIDVIYDATMEVGSAIMTAVATTVVGFLPVFSMIGAEGKLFRPLAFTKTFALVGSIVVALVMIPPFALILFPAKGGTIGRWWSAQLERWKPAKRSISTLVNVLVMLWVAKVLSDHWEPLGAERNFDNLMFVLLAIVGLLLFFVLFMRVYEPILRWCLKNKAIFLSIPVVLVVFGAVVWMGFGTVFGAVPGLLSKIGVDPVALEESEQWTQWEEDFPGLGKEFMPSLDEGSYLFMPTTMPHASIGEALDVVATLDLAIESIPEVELAVGKIGRVESALDPAPISMLETVVNYRPEFIIGESGERLEFKYDEEHEEFVRDDAGELIEVESGGKPFRNWRDEIQSPKDIWAEIVKAAKLTGTVTAPELQPIAARIVMLQSGMRAPLGVKIHGPTLETIESVALQIERLLKQVPAVKAEATLADRVVGKPYLEVNIDREAAARYGVTIANVQDVIEAALGGRTVSTTVEGRERYPIRVRYMRETRDSIEGIERTLVTASNGAQIPLGQLAHVEFVRGPQVIKTEDTFLTAYVIFDKQEGYAEVDAVEECQAYLKDAIASGDLVLPAGVSYVFAGAYENQVRAQKTLMVVLPLALFMIFMILYLQFRAVSTTVIVFSGVFVAWAGGFMMVWMYGQDWFLNFSLFDTNMRDLFSVHPLNLSVAVWVGFLALFGIATDDGVVIATYLKQSFEASKPDTIQGVREAVVVAGKRRCRPCLMTSATTILALLPVLTSTGRGADVMVPMAIPSFGGMTVVLITMFVVPTLYSAVAERSVKRANKQAAKLAAQQVTA